MEFSDKASELKPGQKWVKIELDEPIVIEGGPWIHPLTTTIKTKSPARITYKYGRDSAK